MLEVDRYLMLGIALSASLLLFIVFRQKPFVGLLAWLVALCFTPVWVGVTFGIFLPAIVIVSLLVLASWAGHLRMTLSLVDLVVFSIAILYVFSLLLGRARVADGVMLFFYWLIGYGLGRALPERVVSERIQQALGLAFVAVSVLAILEFLFEYNPFTELLRFSNSQYSVWGSIQERAGERRVEGAFGHSIALGASIALILPTFMASRFPAWVRITGTAALLTATVLTLSRIGIICSAIAVLLSLLLLPGVARLPVRALMLVGLAVVSLIAFVPLAGRFEEAGDEASGSASYRSDLLSLVPEMNPLGVADSFQTTPDGLAYFGNFRSIDSALILFGLSYGSVALLLILGLIMVGIARVLLGRASASSIGLVAQIPALATVALITQYSLFVWFVLGLAVTEQISRARPARRLPDRTPRLAEQKLALP